MISMLCWWKCKLWLKILILMRLSLRSLLWMVWLIKRTWTNQRLWTCLFPRHFVLSLDYKLGMCVLWQLRWVVLKLALHLVLVLVGFKLQSCNLDLDSLLGWELQLLKLWVLSSTWTLCLRTMEKSPFLDVFYQTTFWGCSKVNL